MDSDDDGAGDCGCSGKPAAEHDPDERRPCEPTILRNGPGFVVYELFPRITFSWGNVEANGSLSHIASPYVVLEAMPQAMLIVRIHENAMSVRGKAAVVVQAVSLSADEPETTFTWALALARVDIAPTDDAGKCMTARLRSDVGTHMRVEIQLDQDVFVTPNSLTLSADLVARVPMDAYEEEARACSPV